MMNRGRLKPTIRDFIKKLVIGDPIMDFLKEMRMCQFYMHRGGVKLAYHKLRYNKLSLKLGFSIGFNVFGYGLVIPHYGTIVVGNSNHCGNYCVLHTSTCISDNGIEIGDSLYLATGAKITAKVILGDNISVGANSVVNKSFEAGNEMIAGTPAMVIKYSNSWYERDGISFKERVTVIESLKQQLK